MTLQDFSVINSHVNKLAHEFSKDAVDAFYFLVLESVLGLPEDEIRDAITDNRYHLNEGLGKGGHDRGIDAVYIDDSSDDYPTVHMFNCKYTSKPDKIDNYIESGEIDKILQFLSRLLNKDADLQNDINPILYGKVQEIWDLFANVNPNLSIHICTNHTKGFEKREEARFEREIGRYSNFKIEYHLNAYFVDLLTRKGKHSVNAKVKAIDTNYFQKASGDIRALIVNIDARDLIRIVLDNEEIRLHPNLEDYEELLKYNILDDAFEDNVRVYLRQRTTINQGIKKTALSNENHRFFYFNNGITIICDRYSYLDKQRSPVIELTNIQIVNGCQTIFALHEAFRDDPVALGNVDILCRIYETKHTELGVRIAEYTNTQNPVKGRDIRSIDPVQQKLDAEFLAKGYFYERKKNQYLGKPRHLRLDAEKAGQALSALFNQQPADAKQDRQAIFGKKYENIFNDTVDADRVLLAYKLYESINSKKNAAKARLFTMDPDLYATESFILYASYHILYVLGDLAGRDGVPLIYANFSEIRDYYDEAVQIIRNLIEAEQKTAQRFALTTFFKSNKLVKLVKDYIQLAP